MVIKGVYQKQLQILRTAFAALILAILSACTNNVNIRGSFSTTVVPSTDPGSTVDGTDDGAFTLSRVVKNALDPTNTLDLIGDGSGSLGNLCQPTGDGEQTSTSPTVCECSYEYTTASGASQRIFTPVTYHETNLLRCSYTGIPTNVTSITVRIHLTSADTYSTKVNFKFNGNGITLDPANPETFAFVHRYQCRDIANIRYLLDPTTIYDPIQSEDPHFTYPLNYYTTNFGGSVARYAEKSGSDAFMWNCPSILNPSGYMSDPYLSTYYSTNHINMNIYSKAFLNGSKLIYPPASGVFDRSSFYLARQATGIFNVPVNAYIAPNIVTQENADPSPPPLGYGASPISNGVGGQETCPDTSASIPSGYKWVKIWLFRASLTPRRYATIGGGGQGGSVGYAFYCNPGDWAMDTANTVGQFQPIIPACDTELGSGHAGSNTSISMRQVSGTQYLADRIVQLGTSSNYMCFRLQASGGAGIGSNYCGTNPGPGCDDNYGDFWKVESRYSTNATNAACFLSTPQDPFNVCNTVSNPARAPRIESDQFSLVTDEPNGRYDYLFVVTPPNITVKDMQDTSPFSSPSLPYQPYRYKSNDDCLSSDPDNPTTSGDCSLANKIDYGLKLHDVSSNEDPTGTDPNRAGMFPVCALQKEGS